MQYRADQFSTGGTANSTTDPIAGTNEDTLFQTERYGSYSYEVPVTNATYSLKLHFVELYQTTAGNRSFNVVVEGVSAATSLDLFGAAGHDTAHTIDVNNVPVSDGKLTIELETLVDNATIAGFAIFSADGKFVEPEPEPEPEPGTSSAENPGADCQVPALPAASGLPNQAKLPDPFLKLSGTRITSKSEWKCRRQETLRQAYTYIYGEKPAKPTVTGSVTNSAVSVSVSNNNRTLNYSATLELPSTGRAPYPAVIALSFTSAQLKTALKERGIAIINFNDGDVAADASNISGGFYNLYGTGHSAGTLMATAWGASRIIDVLEANPTLLNPTKIGITGCSRWGKAAFAAGAFDARIALTMPVESGVGGLSALKLIPVLNGPSTGGEQPAHAINYRPWYSRSAFTPFATNTAKLPIDTHQIVGLVAPRGLYIMDNPGNLQNYRGLNIESTYAATVAGKRIYQALGAEDAVTFVGASGDHCAWRNAYLQPLIQNANRFLLGQSGTTGQVTTDAGAVNISQYVDWTVPTLSGELNLAE